MNLLTLLIVLILLGGWGGGGGLGWAGYHGYRSRNNPDYRAGNLIHLFLVIAVLVLVLRLLGIHHL